MKRNSATSTQKEEFQQLLQAHAAAWSKAIEEPEAPARFFAPDEDVICFDLIPPFAGYRSWQQFKKSVPDAISKAVFTMYDGLQVKCKGDLAWTILTFQKRMCALSLTLLAVDLVVKASLGLILS